MIHVNEKAMIRKDNELCFTTGLFNQVTESSAGLDQIRVQFAAQPVYQYFDYIGVALQVLPVNVFA